MNGAAGLTLLLAAGNDGISKWLWALRSIKDMKTTALAFLLLSACGKQAAPPEVRSPFYLAFDPQKALERFEGRFRERSASGCRTDLRITPPGDMFRDFRIEGAIDETVLKSIVEELKADLARTAGACGVEVTSPATDVTKAAPALLKVLFGRDDVTRLWGFTLSYRHGRTEGAADVLVDASTVTHVKFACAVHER